MKEITTRSGVAYEGHLIPTPKKAAERETEETTDKEETNFQGSTAHIQPLVTLNSKRDVPKTLPKPNIPYPLRLNDQNLGEKATNQMEKFFQIFQDLCFDISFTDALILMPKFASTIKSLLTNKDMLFELAKIPLNENCSAMLLKNLPEKLGDRGNFLIPSDRSITRPKGVSEDVFVKVGKFYFSTDFVVVDFKADPWVPLILGRSFLRTDRALIDDYGEAITLRVNDKAVTFNLNQTARYSSTISVNRIDVIDVASEEYAQNEFCFSTNSTGGNPTSTSKPIFYSSPSLTPFEGIDSSLKEIEAYLKDDLISPKIDYANYDLERDICLIEKLLNNESSLMYTTFSNLPFDCNNDFTSRNDKSLSNEDISMENFKIYSNPLFEEADFDLEEEIRLVENFSNDNSFLPPIPVEDSDSHMEEIDLFLASDDLMLPGIENNDHDSEGDIRELISAAMNNIDELIKMNVLTQGEVRLMFLQMLKMTITFPLYLSFEFFYHISSTLRFLFYFSPPGVKTPFLTSASPLRAGGISSGRNFHVL
uniref:Reverse transcriptase domain-containing protein n=1 Tax=Tanacetum cinerariifolium TaxID=118510 RepID=A0A699L9Z2_TANCI|nr:reverse transcriptase domain-containing protein [Tanacetum cinerariifolium]